MYGKTGKSQAAMILEGQPELHGEAAESSESSVLELLKGMLVGSCVIAIGST
jgi:hypothetical protein